MTSTAMMLALFAAYVVIALASALEKNWPRCFYFVGAAIIILSTVEMQR